MREGISIEVSAADRERLAAVVADRNSPQKHVWRARIILATGEGCGTAEIMRRAGVSKPCVWRDPRDPERVRHELAKMIRYRALLIAAGYPDGNDCDALKADPDAGGKSQGPASALPPPPLPTL